MLEEKENMKHNAKRKNKKHERKLRKQLDKKKTWNNYIIDVIDEEKKVRESKKKSIE